MGQAEGRCCCGVQSDGKVQVIQAQAGSGASAGGTASAPRSVREGDNSNGVDVTSSADKQPPAARPKDPPPSDVPPSDATTAGGGGTGPGFDLQSEGGQSTGSQASGASSAYQEMSKEQRQEAKRLIKEFVRSMVKGRKIDVVLSNGQLKTCFISLSRSLDALKIKASEKDKQERRIQLASIDELLAGSDVSQSQVCEGLETPLDELSVTLALSTEECITFRMPDADARDTMVMCLTMFSNEARQKLG